MALEAKFGVRAADGWSQAHMILPTYKGSWESIWLSKVLHELQLLKHRNGGLDAGRQPPEIVLSAMQKKAGERRQKVISFEEGYSK